MAVIDDKVVAMSFESSKFESGVNKTIASLDKLKAALHFPNAGKGLQDIDAAAKKVDLSHISKGVDGVKKALEAMRLVAIGVMSQLAAQAVRAGGRFVKAFTLDPLKAGFAEYSTNLNAVQTILANTQAAGVGLKEVNATLKELNEYSDKTIYNFSQMAKNIGTFTAAGVELKTATASIKGIANLAALSGSNAEQASTAMYQLSQAIAAGSVKLQDWNSVVNAGMGGTVFQRALAQTAEAVGTLEKGAVKLEGPMKNVTIAGEAFRQSLSTPGKASWLTSEVLTKTLKQFTGDLKDAELAAMGFNDEQIKAIQQTAKTAMFAATEVKTISQVFDVAKETAASGWAATFQIIFGTFTEAKKTFTELSNAINGFINASADARNKVLGDWKALGGRTVLIDSIKVAFHNLGLIIAPIKEAFRDIFPATTGKDLYNLTLLFKNFAEALKPSQETVDGLKRTFRGLFALLSIGAQIVKGMYTMWFTLFGAIGKGSGSFLDITGSIGDFLVSVDAALKKGDRLHNFFVTLGNILSTPIKLLSLFADALSNLFEGFSSAGISDEVDGVAKALSPFERILTAVSKAWNAFIGAFEGSGDIFRDVGQAVGEGLGNFAVAFGDAMASMNFEAILAVLRTGLLAGIVIMFKKFLGKGSAIDQITQGFGKGILGNISGSFKALEGSMVAMQNNIKAKTLKEIAIAIALLTASVVALAFVDPDRLKSSLTAMTVAFGQLLGAMAILGNITKTIGFIKMPVIAAGMIALAGAMVILSAAVVILAQLSWEELAKGLGGVGVMLAMISAAVIPLSANSAGMVRAGVGIAAMAVGLRIMANAVEAFARMNMTELAKGLGSVAVSLGIIVVTMTKIKPAGMITAGIAIIAMATGLRILAEAVEKFGGMDLRTMGQGLAAVGASLVAIGLAMRLMPKNMIVMGAGLLIVSIALGRVADAVASMGGMSIREIAKGLIALGGALGILAAALYLMSGSLAGAAALGIAAAGVALLVPPLTALGKLSWTSLIKGLVALAAAFTIIGLAGYLITAAVPGLLGFGAAMLLIGGGLALAGAGLFLISAALSALIVSLPTGVGILIAALVELQEGIVKNVKLFALGLVEIGRAFAAVAPKLVESLIKVLNSIIDGVIQIMPKLKELTAAMIEMMLDILDQNEEKLVQGGLGLLLALLEGIRNNIPQLVKVITDIIARFLTAVANNLGKIITAGGKILTKFIEGILKNITNVATTVATIITRFITAIGNNINRIVNAGANMLTRFLSGIANNLGKVIKAGTDIIVTLITGIGNAGPRIVTAAVQAVVKFCAALGKQVQPLANAALKLIIDLLNGLAIAIDQNAEKFGHAAARLGIAMVSGLATAIRAGVGDIKDALLSLIPGPLKKFASKLGITSPSKVFYQFGEYIIDGLALGITDTDSATKAMDETANGIIASVNDIFQTASPSKVMYQIGKFVGEGFANGLKGSADDVRNAFATLNQKLKDEMVRLREDTTAEQDRLAELLEAKQDKLDDINSKKWKKSGDKAKAIADVQKQYTKSIQESEDAINSNEAALKRLTAAQKTLNKDLQDERVNLIKLANDFDKVSAKLKQAQEDLKALIKERDDYAKSLTDKYATPPEISKPMTEEIKSARENIAAEQKKLDALLGAGTQDLEKIAEARKSVGEAQAGLDELIAGKVLTGDGSAVDVIATYLQDLKNQTTAVSAYAATLEQLRKLGLDDKTYRMLVEEGTAQQGFAEALLAGGKTAVKSVNTLDEDLNTEAQKLAVSSAEYLYNAGIKTAEGFVKGFEKDRALLLAKVGKLGKDIIKQFKKALGIKSPSEEFATIGRQSMEGMAKGLEESSSVVIDAADQVAKDAMDAMRKSMTDISTLAANELTTNPVITPVLDLTTVRSQAGELATLTTPGSTAYGLATSISTGQNAQEEESVPTLGGTHVKFEQNNYSPDALTEIEIYRQTKNQLSQLRSVLSAK